MKKQKEINAKTALKRLKDGNARFVENIRCPTTIPSKSIREYLASTTQKPFAIILCCSDSRAPAEIVFDQGLGDLFVVRVAGNIIAPSLVGSVEFAASMFGSQLVVVMGHTGCGAVTATIDAIRNRTKAKSKNIQDIIQRILPQIENLVSPDISKEKLMAKATRANIKASVSQLKHGSKLLEKLVMNGKIQIIGAEYDLSSGKVAFLDEVK